MKKLVENKALAAFLLSFLLGSIIIIPNIIGGHGIYEIAADLNLQQIPFNKIFNYSIKEGSILWTWYNDLGSNFIATFSFYNLLSPFNIIGYLFPASLFEYIIGPIFILKYAVAGLTSYLFISRYVKNKNYAIIGSLLYAFSGFQLTNILFYHFHDIVAFFPLLLYTLDNLVLDNKKGRFALVVALCAFTNWFFFIEEVIFVIIYFIVRVLTKSYKINFKIFTQVFIEGLLGTLLASIILIPSFLFTLGNPRVTSTWTLESMIKYTSTTYLEIIRSFLFSPELMKVRSIITEENYTSLEIYLPFVGCALFIPYILKNIKKWPSILFIICVIIMFFPILNSIFFLFNSTYYARWFFMPILIMALMSSLCLDNNYKIENGILFSILGYAIFFIAIYLYVDIYTIETLFYDTKYFILSLSITLLSLFALYYIYNIKNKKTMYILLLISIFGFVGIWGNYMTYKYKTSTFKTKKFYTEFLNSNKNLKKYSNYMTNSSESCCYNMAYIARIKNLYNFNSNLNGTSFEFYNSIDYVRGVSTIVQASDTNLNNYLGVQYLISCYPSDHFEQYGYNFVEQQGPYAIYSNPNYKEYGFGTNEYISKKDFKKLSTEEKKQVLNEKIVLTNRQIKKYGYLYNDNNPVIYNSNEFKYIKNGFKSKIDSNKETLAIYTIPYDKGWTATINGKKTKIEKVDNGMMAIKINSGENNIKFNYFTPGLKEGIIVTIISIILYIIYMIVWDNKKVRRRV